MSGRASARPAGHPPELSATSCSVRARLRSRLRCPWCRRDASWLTLRVACDACGVAFHAACAAEAESCPTLGCAGRFGAPRPRRWRRAATGRRGTAVVGWGLLFALCSSSARLAGPAPAAQTSGAPDLRLAFETLPPDWTEVYECRPTSAHDPIPEFEPPLEFARVLPQFLRIPQPEEVPQVCERQPPDCGRMTPFGAPTFGRNPEPRRPRRTQPRPRLCGNDARYEVRRLRPTQRHGLYSLESWRQLDVSRALRWLQAAQAPDGGWSSETHSRAGATALALAAFAVNGSSLQEGDYRPSVRRGLRWLRNQQLADGGFGVEHPEDTPLGALALALLERDDRTDGELRMDALRAWQALSLSSAWRAPSEAWDAVATSLVQAALHLETHPAYVRSDLDLDTHDLAQLLDHPNRWAHASWFTPLGSSQRARWETSLVAYLHGKQDPAGAWTDEGEEPCWATARNALALGLLAWE